MHGLAQHKGSYIIVRNFVYSTQGALSNQNPNRTAFAIDVLQSLMSEVIKFHALEDLKMSTGDTLQMPLLHR